MGNHIGKEQLAKLQEIMRSKPNLVSLCGIADDATEADLSGLDMDADDAAILASELPDKGALSSLNLSMNKLGGFYEGYTGGGSGYGPQAVTITCIACNCYCPITSGNGRFTATTEGPIAVANAIKDMGAMTKFDISSNDLRAEGTKLLAAALKGNQIMTELNISSNSMTYGSTWGDMSGVIALADVISDMGAMTGLDLSSNYLQAVPSLVNAIAQLSTLTQVNLSGNGSILPGAWE
jgi:hypothetical protein